MDTGTVVLRIRHRQKTKQKNDLDAVLKVVTCMLLWSLKLQLTYNYYQHCVRNLSIHRQMRVCGEHWRLSFLA